MYISPLSINEENIRQPHTLFTYSSYGHIFLSNFFNHIPFLKLHHFHILAGNAYILSMLLYFTEISTGSKLLVKKVAHGNKLTNNVEVLYFNISILQVNSKSNSNPKYLMMQKRKSVVSDHFSIYSFIF